MKVDAAYKLTVQIELTSEEAVWLRALMQNPHNHGETPQQKRMREELFKALTAAGARNEQR